MSGEDKVQISQQAEESFSQRLIREQAERLAMGSKAGQGDGNYGEGKGENGRRHQKNYNRNIGRH